MSGVMRFLALVCFVLAGCDSKPNAIAKSDIAKAVKPDESPAANCASRAAFDIIRDQVFDAAIAKVEGKESAKLNSLRAVIAGRLEAPIVSSHDEAIGRTECMGKVVFGLPPNTQKAFGDADALTADINYAVQKAADGTGLVVDATGTEAMVQSLIAGAKLKRIVPARIPSPTSVQPLPIEGLFDPPPRTDFELPEVSRPPKGDDPGLTSSEAGHPDEDAGLR